MASDRGQNRYSDFVALERLLRFENCSPSNCLLSSWGWFRVFESPYPSFHRTVFFGAPLAFLRGVAMGLCRRCQSWLHFYVFVSSDLPFVDCVTYLTTVSRHFKNKMATKVKGQKKEMSEFSLQLSPSCNLKNHVSSAICEVIRLLENFSLYGNDEEQLDFTLYKLEQIVYLCVNGQNIQSDFLTDEIIQLLLTAYKSLSKENDDTHSNQPSSSCQLIYTCPVGLGGCCRIPGLNHITMVIFKFGVQICLGLFTRMYYKMKWLFPCKNCYCFSRISIYELNCFHV